MSELVEALREECYAEQYSGWYELCTEAADRIEGLEKIKDEYDEYIELTSTGPLANYHIITHDQIDAAWGSTLQHSDYEVVKRALAELGIERCEVCRGEASSMEWGEGALICSNCNGKGWSIK